MVLFFQGKDVKEKGTKSRLEFFSSVTVYFEKA